MTRDTNAKPAAAKPAELIRLDDLLPRRNVVGGTRTAPVVFGTTTTQARQRRSPGTL
jgi:hypothetical protein